jgi:hypothetical protein
MVDAFFANQSFENRWSGQIIVHLDSKYHFFYPSFKFLFLKNHKKFMVI